MTQHVYGDKQFCCHCAPCDRTRYKQVALETIGVTSPASQTSDRPEWYSTAYQKVAGQGNDVDFANGQVVRSAAVFRFAQ